MFDEPADRDPLGSMILALARCERTERSEPPDDPSLSRVALPMFGGDSDLGRRLGDRDKAER